MRPLLSLSLLTAAAAGVVAVSSSAAPLPGSLGNAAPVTAAPAQSQAARGVHAFYFTRGIYSDYRGGGFGGGFGRGGGSWSVDYPKADLQFVTVLRRLTNLDAYNSEHGHAVRLDDPELRRYPFLYMLEVGRIALTQAEVEGLRGYLLAGGFVFVDDFWGENEWYPFAQQMKIVLPEYEIVDVSLDHPLFNTFYDINEVQQMPAINAWRAGRTTECFGCEVAVRGIFAEDGRLLMLIHWNTDNGDAWEWAEQPDIPLKFTTYAYQIGINAVVYTMSH